MSIFPLHSLKNSQFDTSVWILDTGATAHMCADLSHIEKSNNVSKYTLVYLPDGSVKSVTHT